MQFLNPQKSERLLKATVGNIRHWQGTHAHAQAKTYLMLQSKEIRLLRPSVFRLSGQATEVLNNHTHTFSKNMFVRSYLPLEGWVGGSAQLLNNQYVKPNLEYWRVIDFKFGVQRQFESSH